jgi:hypothetical protein
MRIYQADEQERQSNILRTPHEEAGVHWKRA